MHGASPLTGVPDAVCLRSRVRRAMTREENEYLDPDEFNPERFLLDGVPNPKVRDPQKHVFGFGRRYASPELSRDSAS